MYSSNVSGDLSMEEILYMFLEETLRQRVALTELLIETGII